MFCASIIRIGSQVSYMEILIIPNWSYWSISEWSDENNTSKLNVKKKKEIHFVLINLHCPPHVPLITVNGTCLERDNHVTLLGMILPGQPMSSTFLLYTLKKTMGMTLLSKHAVSSKGCSRGHCQNLLLKDLPIGQFECTCV